MKIGILAFLLDSLIGDPRSRFHPVVLIGQLIAGLEKMLYPSGGSSRRKFFSGFILMLLVLIVSYTVTAVILYGVARFNVPYLAMGVEALILSFMISPRNLAEAGREIQTYRAS